MNIKQLIKQRVGDKRYPTLKRIKVGRVLGVIAALPLFTSPLFLLSIPMMMTISPTAWLKGKINTFKGNGDLQW